MSVVNLMNQINNHEIVLPAIQRNFVWAEDRIYTLLDSIIRGYPVGIVLLWETYDDLPPFVTPKLRKLIPVLRPPQNLDR